jgi:hypothetical protein
VTLPPLLPHPSTAGRRESFEHVRSWYERAKQLGGQDIEPVLIGNKSDLSRSLVQVPVPLSLPPPDPPLGLLSGR